MTYEPVAKSSPPKLANTPAPLTLEITSGLTDDSREADEKEAERRLRDLRGRVKAARALVSSTPGLAEILAGDWRKAARFYARFGTSEHSYRYGVPEGGPAKEITSNG